MKRVYVAGPMSGCEIDYIHNIGRMSAACRGVWQLGFAPFNPAGDLLMGLAAGVMGNRPTVEAYKAVGMAWLEVSDAVYVIGDSPGVRAEIERAGDLGIPVYWDLHDLKEALK